MSIRDRGSGHKVGRYEATAELGRDGEGKRHRQRLGRFDTRRDAEAAIAKARDEHRRRQRGELPELTTMTLAEYVTAVWLPAVAGKVRPSTFSSYWSLMFDHVLPRIGRIQLQALTALQIEALYADLARSGRKDGTGGLSQRSVQYVAAVLHAALADAVKHRLVVVNVATAAGRPKVERGADDDLHVWSAEQLRTFLDATRGHEQGAAWHLASHTGMRRGEVLGLRWRDVDLDKGRLQVRQTVVAVGSEVQASTPKTARGRRPIDLDPETVEVLRRHRRHLLEVRVAFGAGWHDAGADALVFPRTAPDALGRAAADLEPGRWQRPTNFSAQFDRAVAALDDSVPRIRLHDLRHTHASLLLNAGVPIHVVSQRLGHATAGFTLNTYAHVIEGQQAEAAEAFARLVAEG